MSAQELMDKSPCVVKPASLILIDCPNMKCTYESMAGERYRCEVCGESVWLDYDEMR